MGASLATASAGSFEASDGPLPNQIRVQIRRGPQRRFLLKQMEDYFFGKGASFPPGYVPPRAT